MVTAVFNKQAVLLGAALVSDGLAGSETVSPVVDCARVLSDEGVGGLASDVAGVGTLACLSAFSQRLVWCFPLQCLHLDLDLHRAILSVSPQTIKAQIFFLLCQASSDGQRQCCRQMVNELLSGSKCRTWV